MTTSNSTNFTMNAGECIRFALEKIGVIGEGDQLGDYDGKVGLITLNLLLKSWQNYDNHLWAKQTVTLFPQKAQASYTISATTTDHLTADDFIETQTTIAAVTGNVSITVNSITGINAGDYIGIQLDSGSWFWTTVNGTPSGLVVTITNALTGNVAIGSYVVTYTHPLDVPFQIYDACRRTIIDKTDIELECISYKEYFLLPNKLSTGTPNCCAYDRQLGNYKIFLWLTPSDVSLYVRLIISRKIQDIDNVSDTLDIPEEALEAFILNLAVALSVPYKKAKGDNFAALKMDAEEAKRQALSIDNESGSIYIQPSRRNKR